MAGPTQRPYLARMSKSAPQPSAAIRVTVRGSDASYDVHIEPGSLQRLPEVALAVAPAVRFIVVADANVAKRVAPIVLETLRAERRTDLFTFPAGESHKTRSSWAALTDAMLDAGVGRDACVVALGGGVTGDLAGFIAATYMRGLPWLQVPTSLLAMIDASIGGKTGVDVESGKNLVGAFHQPRAVVVDPTVLATLPVAELRNGLAEAVKHAALADPKHLDWIHDHADGLLAGVLAPLTTLVRRSVEIKASIVSADPAERGQRATLNFGHTLAHAIERVTDFAVPHGRAVAIGMVCEARIGEAAGVTEAGTAERIASVLTRLGLPTRLPDGVSPAALLDASLTDKKVRSGRIRWALLEAIGRAARDAAGAWTLDVPDETVLVALGA